jgi:serine/threonine protein kinase
MKAFAEELKWVTEQKSFEDQIYKDLFKQISFTDLCKIINYILANQDQYASTSYQHTIKSPIGSDTLSPYYQHLTIQWFLKQDTGVFLNILTQCKTAYYLTDYKGRLKCRIKDKENIKKISGSVKKGCPSFTFSAHGLTKTFTTVSKGKDDVNSVIHEKKLLTYIQQNPFVLKPLIGEPYRKTGAIHLCISTCAPLAVCDSVSLAFNKLEDFLVGIKCLSLGLKAIGDAKIVHQDLKRKNVLLMEDGRLVIIDFGIAQFEFKGQATSTPGSLAPEVIADIIREQRITLKDAVDSIDAMILEELATTPLNTQIAGINKILQQKKLYPTKRYLYHCVTYIELNEFAIRIYEKWRGRSDLSTLRFPNRKQDMWSFGVVVSKLINEITFSLDEDVADFVDKTIHALIINAPPALRLTIEEFLGRFENLLTKLEAKKIEGISNINVRIKKYIQKFEDDNGKSKSKTNLPSLKDSKDLILLSSKGKATPPHLPNKQPSNSTLSALTPPG